jgi:hypothetical protein
LHYLSLSYIYSLSAFLSYSFPMCLICFRTGSHFLLPSPPPSLSLILRKVSLAI